MLGVRERAVLTVLLEHRGRVVGRVELARRAGLTGSNQRRCDSILVNIRRALGPDSLRTVRGRGWMLETTAEPTARAMMVEPMIAGRSPAD
jgi:DNA-binding response OmpR family regulator